MVVLEEHLSEKYLKWVDLSKMDQPISTILENTCHGIKCQNLEIQSVATSPWPTTNSLKTVSHQEQASMRFQLEGLTESIIFWKTKSKKDINLLMRIWKPCNLITEISSYLKLFLSFSKLLIKWEIFGKIIKPINIMTCCPNGITICLKILLKLRFIMYLSIISMKHYYKAQNFLFNKERPF